MDSFESHYVECRGGVSLATYTAAGRWRCAGCGREYTKLPGVPFSVDGGGCVQVVRCPACLMPSPVRVLPAAEQQNEGILKEIRELKELLAAERVDREKALEALRKERATHKKEKKTPDWALPGDPEKKLSVDEFFGFSPATAIRSTPTGAAVMTPTIYTLTYGEAHDKHMDWSPTVKIDLERRCWVTNDDAAGRTLRALIDKHVFKEYEDQGQAWTLRDLQDMLRIAQGVDDQARYRCYAPARKTDVP